MCWIGDNKHKHIATEDIKCKKVLYKPDTNLYLSPIYNVEYKVGETYTSNPIKTKLYGSRPHLIILEGIHCYSAKTKALMTNDTFGKKILMIYSLRFLNGKYKYSPLLSWGPYSVIMECIIPKGTVYYENENGEIVAQKLKVIREFKIEEYK